MSDFDLVDEADDAYTGSDDESSQEPYFNVETGKVRLFLGNN